MVHVGGRRRFGLRFGVLSLSVGLLWLAVALLAPTTALATPKVVVFDTSHGQTLSEYEGGFADDLRAAGYAVTTNGGNLQNVAGADVLVVNSAGANRIYDSAEAGFIANWVRLGGRLFLLTDAGYATGIASFLGIYTTTSYVGPVVTEAQPGGTPHPIVAGLDPTRPMQFGGSAFTGGLPILFAPNSGNAAPLAEVSIAAGSGMAVVHGDGDWLLTAGDLYTGTYRSNPNYARLAMQIVGALCPLPPVAADSSVTVLEDDYIDITLPASDADGDALTYSIVGYPAHGNLYNLNGSNRVTYKAFPNYNGPDSFTFKANDGTLDSNVARVSITVQPMQDAPVALAPPTVIVPDENETPITLGAYNPDGGLVTWAYTLLSQPQHGTLSGTPPNLSYKKSAGYYGPDSFTFKVNNGIWDSSAATVYIEAVSNGSPRGADQTVSTPIDTPCTMMGSFGFTDAGDTTPDNFVGIMVMSLPQDGTLSKGSHIINSSDVSNGYFVAHPVELVYTPAPGGSGSPYASFTFRVCDSGWGNFRDENNKRFDRAEVANTVTINVLQPNRAPVASSQSVSANEDEAKAITLGATDLDGDPLLFTVLAPPAHGTLTGVAPALTYTPAANYNGPDSFTFKANDGTVDSNVAQVALTVVPVNDAPVATTDSAETNEDLAVEIVLGATDVDGDPLTYAVVGAPAHGALSAVAGNKVTYTPAANYNGPDSFTFKANDGTVDSNVAQVALTVVPVNDAPVATAGAASTDENATVEITLVGSDVDGDSLVYEVVDAPTHGVLSAVTGSKVAYTPNGYYNGPDSFTFRANDGTVDSDPSAVSITVKPVNYPPTAVDQSYATDEDITLVVSAGDGVLAGATDADGDTLTARTIDQPAHGVLVLAEDGSFKYTPNGNYNGSDSFTFVANDATVDSPVSTVEITVKPVNDAPVLAANHPSVAVGEGQLASMSGTWSDIEGDAVVLSTSVGNAVCNNDGTWSWTFSTADGPAQSQTVKITAEDAQGGKSTAEFDLVVNNLAPSVAAISSPSAPILGGSASYSAAFTDPGANDTHLAVWNWGDGSTAPGTITEAGGSGTAKASHTYTSPGAYSITLTITDKDGAAATATTKVVVASQAGWVTGAGYFDSPAGALKSKPTAKGKATFALLASAVGKCGPSGVFSFELPSAGWRFSSTACDLVTVYRGRVNYRGRGSIGKTACSFLVTAIDAKTTSDHNALVRIKIWETKTGQVLYDSQMNAADEANPVAIVRGGTILSGN